MKLLFLSKANLADRLFVKDFVHNFQGKEKVLILHDVWPSLGETLTVMKRISAMMSEAMVYNNAFAADQRGLVKMDEEGKYQIATEKIQASFQYVQALILSPVIQKATGREHAEVFPLLQALRYQLEAEEILLFPANPLSPLGKNQPIITDQASKDQLLGIYDEEATTLERAYQLRPTRLVSPTNFLT